MQSSGAIPGLCFGYIDYCVELSNARLRELIEGPIQIMLDNFSFTRVRSYRGHRYSTTWSSHYACQRCPNGGVGEHLQTVDANRRVVKQCRFLRTRKMLGDAFECVP